MKESRRNGIIWGIFLIVIAVMLLMKELGVDFSFGKISLIEWVILLACAEGLISGLMKKKLWTVCYSLGFAYCVLDDVLKLPIINIWVMFLIVTVGGIGLHLIFSRNKTKVCKVYRDGQEIEIKYNSLEDLRSKMGEELKDEDDTVFQEGSFSTENDFLSNDVVFSSITKYIDSKHFMGGNTDVVFSSAKYYFDRCTLNGGNATINMEVVFSNVTIYVPASWNVVDNMGKIFSSKNIVHDWSEGNPTLVLEGDCVFGNVNIVRI